MSASFSGLIVVFLLVLNRAFADPVSLKESFDASSSLSAWACTAGKVTWVNEGGDGVIQILSDNDGWTSFRRDDLPVDPGAYSLSFRTKIDRYGADTPLFVRVYDGTYAMEIKLLTNGVNFRTSSGWMIASNSLIAAGAYRNFALCADGAFVNLYVDDQFITGFQMPAQTSSVDRLQFLAKGSAGRPSQNRISSVVYRGAPVVSGSVSNWRSGSIGALSALIPVSPRTDIGGVWSSSITEAYTNSGSKWSITNWTEASVFQARIKHNQYDSKTNLIPSRSWDLRIGRGGQIYSMKTGAGEIIPPQYRSTYGGQWAPWVDDVWQHVAVRTTNENYFHHQAGVYLNKQGTTPPELDHPFYSPMLMAGALTNTTYVTASWSQQAHVPTPHRSHAVTYQQTRNVGSGIIEVTYVVHNFGKELNYFNVPWGGVRRSTFEYHYITNTNGLLVLQPHIPFGSGTVTVYSATAGWVAYAATNNLNSGTAGMALVFGKDHQPLDAFQRAVSRWSWGYTAGSNTGNETNWRNFLVGSAIRPATLRTGDTYFSRHYFVLGGMAELPGQVRTYGLVTNANYGLLTYSTNTTARLSWYVGTDGLLTRVVQSGKPVWISTWAAPVPGSKPLFYLRSVISGRVFVSTNPYLLCDEPDVGYNQTAYDGFTEYIGLLGYTTGE